MSKKRETMSKKRERGEGSVYQPKYRDRHGTTKTSKIWRIKWADLYGNPQSESSKSAKKAIAVRLLRKRTEARDRGKPSDVLIERTTFADLAAMIENDYRANERRSLKRLLRSLKHLRGFFGEYRAIQITEDRITAYKVFRKEEAENATINRELAALKRGFKLAYKAGKVARIPVIELLVEDNVRKGFVPRGHFESILEHVPDCPSDDNLLTDCYWREVFEVAYITGWRAQSEILTRQWSHVDFAGEWVRLEPGETKNKQGRNFPMTPELREVLERQRAYVTRLEKATGRIIPWLFPNPKTGSHLKSYTHVWNKARRAAGLPAQLVHDFRRTAVRNLERARVPRSDAKAMVGHLTDSIYNRYAISDEESLKESAKKLSNFHLRETGEKKVLPLAQDKLKTQARRKKA